jgi:hypothetical protein
VKTTDTMIDPRLAGRSVLGAAMSARRSHEEEYE